MSRTPSKPSTRNTAAAKSKVKTKAKTLAKQQPASSTSATTTSASTPPAVVHIVGGVWKRSRIEAPAVPGLRPTLTRVRVTVFDWLAPVIRGARGWDMFAGSGALGFEAASRGAAQVLLTETEPRLLDAMRRTQTRLHAEQVCLLRHDARLPLPTSGAQAAAWREGFDLFWLDPPFEAWQTCVRAALQQAQPHARAGALLYLELPRDCAAELATLLDEVGLLTVRQSQAGQVAFGLYRFAAAAV